MIGMHVFTEDGAEFGTLRDVLETGANDVYIIDTTDGKEVLVPAIKQCILNVDIEEQKMTIHLLEGLGIKDAFSYTDIISGDGLKWTWDKYYWKSNGK